MKTRILTTALTGLLVTSLFTASIPGAFAGSGKGGYCENSAHGMKMDHGKAGKHIDGRVAFLKAELDIQANQEPAWQAFESVMRDNHANKGHGKKHRHEMKGLSAPEKIEQHISHMEQRLTHMKSMQGAMTELYAVLDDSQRQTANELLPPMGRKIMRK